MSTEHEIDWSTFIPGIADASFDESEFELVQIGFFPYWRPVLQCEKCYMPLSQGEIACKLHASAKLIGNSFVGTVMGADHMGTFPRIHVMADVDMRVLRGPSTAPRPETLARGAIFSLSPYEGLPLLDYEGMRVMVSTLAKRVLPPSKTRDEPRTFYEFALRVDKRDKTMLESTRKEALESARKLALERHLKRISEGALARPALAERRSTPRVAPATDATEVHF